MASNRMNEDFDDLINGETSIGLSFKFGKRLGLRQCKSGEEFSEQMDILFRRVERIIGKFCNHSRLKIGKTYSLPASGTAFQNVLDVDNHYLTAGCSNAWKKQGIYNRWSRYFTAAYDKQIDLERRQEKIDCLKAKLAAAKAQLRTHAASVKKAKRVSKKLREMHEASLDDVAALIEQVQVATDAYWERAAKFAPNAVIVFYAVTQDDICSDLDFYGTDAEMLSLLMERTLTARLHRRYHDRLGGNDKGGTGRGNDSLKPGYALYVAIDTVPHAAQL
jgi:hypothetical protein